MTITSLLARARVLPASSAAKAGNIPAHPTVAATTESTSERDTISSTGNVRVPPYPGSISPSVLI